MAESAQDPRFPVIGLPPETDTPEAAVHYLIAELVRAGSLPATDADEVSRQVWQRERLGSTAIGRGMAIPHAKVQAAAKPIGIIGRCARPLRWPGALDGGPVGLVCLLVAPEGSPGEMCRALEGLSRQLRGG